jgi:hypothetical protein
MNTSSRIPVSKAGNPAKRKDLATFEHDRAEHYAAMVETMAQVKLNS